MSDDRIEPREQAEAIRAETRARGGTATLQETAGATAAAITISLSNSGGYIALNWTNSGAIGRWDYVALYDQVPTDPDGYLRRQWDRVESASGKYVTGTSALGVEGPQYWIAYCGWDYSQDAYVIVQTAGPSQP